MLNIQLKRNYFYDKFRSNKKSVRDILYNVFATRILTKRKVYFRSGQKEKTDHMKEKK